MDEILIGRFPVCRIGQLHVEDLRLVEKLSMETEYLVVFVVQGLVRLNSRHAGKGTLVQDVQDNTRGENSEERIYNEDIADAETFPRWYRVIQGM